MCLGILGSVILISLSHCLVLSLLYSLSHIARDEQRYSEGTFFLPILAESVGFSHCDNVQLRHRDDQRSCGAFCVTVKRQRVSGSGTTLHGKNSNN